MVRVLMVDAQSSDSASLASQLEHAGYATVLAPSAREAREQLSGAPFDLLLLEADLIDGDGLRLCNELREQLGGKLIIIFIAANDTMRKRVAALQLGADDFLAKPFECAELLARIEARVRVRQVSSP
jgi:DNA-binding response OmpR family regulator